MRLFAALALCCFSLPALAFDAGQRLDQFAQGLQGLQGRFEQQVIDPQGRVKEESSGEIALSVPRQLRWEYLQPFPQLIIADGEHIFVFDPDLDQVNVRRQLADEQQSPLLALIDPEERGRQFTVKSAGSRDGLDWVELQAKLEDAPIQRALIGLDGSALERMEFSDSLGQSTLVSFSEWKRNPEFAADTFRFAVPAGVDVVGDYTPAAEVLPLND